MRLAVSLIAKLVPNTVPAIFSTSIPARERFSATAMQMNERCTLSPVESFVRKHNYLNCLDPCFGRGPNAGGGIRRFDAAS